MLDLLLDKDGDLDVSALGDISLTESARQAVLVRLRWIYDEWRLGPELGFPWFEEVFVKNPNTSRIRSRIRSTIMEVKEVTDAKVDKVDYDPAKRTATFKFLYSVGDEVFREEVILYNEQH